MNLHPMLVLLFTLLFFANALVSAAGSPLFEPEIFNPEEVPCRDGFVYTCNMANNVKIIIGTQHNGETWGRKLDAICGTDLSKSDITWFFRNIKNKLHQEKIKLEKLTILASN